MQKSAEIELEFLDITSLIMEEFDRLAFCIACSLLSLDYLATDIEKLVFLLPDKCIFVPCQSTQDNSLPDTIEACLDEFPLGRESLKFLRQLLISE